MKVAYLLMVMTIAGCGDYQPPSPNQCLRVELFKQCMASIPAGPVVIGNDNNWGEVIGKCESSSYYQSMREYSTIPPECRGN